MGEKVWVQCSHCGNLHRVKGKDATISENDLFTEPIWCGKCRDETPHIWCGEKQEDVYMYYNANLDPRIY